VDDHLEPIPGALSGTLERFAKKQPKDLGWRAGIEAVPIPILG